MRGDTQRDTNPFPYSDSNKRYHTYDYYLRHTFGTKCAKIPLDGGFTCPNRDGCCGYGGCIYCSQNGSGDFTASALLPIAEQYRIQRERLSAKWNDFCCIPYFQAHTNTYASLPRLQELFEEALTLPDAVGMNIATRADCLPEDVVDYLADLSKRTVLTLELGLQTVHDETAARINRGHTFSDFLTGYERLRIGAPKARIGIHLIFGLIGENDEMMVETAQRVAELRPDEVKLHSLYVLEGTKMAEIYRNGGYLPLERDRYVDLAVRALELMPPETVIGRMTGDGEENSLLAPLWSRKKRCVLNEIDKKFYEKNTWQGKSFFDS
ncbi:MAG: TIGR01212 family radical SAM protein [Clostridia bacterium]|nr:TIGR01212 family radical SAM protein [Clostridia bacterium]